MRKLFDLLIKHKWFVVSLILAVLLVFYRFNQGSIQQDSYITYAEGFPNELEKFPAYFPGLPLAIRILMSFFRSPYVSGYFIALASLCGLYFLLYKMTGSKMSILPLIFPPIILNLATIIGTDMPFIFIVVLAIYLIKKKYLPFAFFVIGISVWFRLAGVAVIFGVFMYYLTTKKLREFFINLPYFLIPIVGLMAYNFFLLGPRNTFLQVSTYQAIGNPNINFVLPQLGMDIVRAFRWRWFRVLGSGVFYIIFYGSILIFSFRKNRLNFGLYLAFLFLPCLSGPFRF